MRILALAALLALASPAEAQTVVACGGVNDTTAIQTALNTANTSGYVWVQLSPPCVSGMLTYYANTRISSWGKGVGPAGGTLQLKAGSNSPLLQSNGFTSLTGSNSTAGVGNLTLDNITLDGNRSNNTGSAPCVQSYGYAHTLDHVEIRNCAGSGIYTEWSTSSGCPSNSVGDICMESHWHDVVAHDNGCDGITDKGPHDSIKVDIIVYYNNQTSSGCGGISNQSTGLYVAFHSWGFTQLYALNAIAPGQFSTGVLEGAAVAGGVQAWLQYPETTLTNVNIFGCGAGIDGIRIGNSTTPAYYEQITGLEIDGGCPINLLNNSGGNRIEGRSTVAIGSGGITGTVSQADDIWLQAAPSSSPWGLHVGGYSGGALELAQGSSYTATISQNGSSQLTMASGPTTVFYGDEAGTIKLPPLTVTAGEIAVATGGLLHSQLVQTGGGTINVNTSANGIWYGTQQVTFPTAYATAPSVTCNPVAVVVCTPLNITATGFLALVWQVTDVGSQTYLWRSQGQ